MKDSTSGADNKNSQKHDIFLSYRRSDAGTFAAMLHSILKERGANIFMDVESLEPNAWESQLMNAVKRCKFFVYVASPEYFLSPNTRKELICARENEKILFPISYGNGFYPEYINIIAEHQKKASNGGYDASAISVANKVLMRPSVEVGFPEVKIPDEQIYELIECAKISNEISAYPLDYKNFSSNLDAICKIVIPNANNVVVQYFKIIFDEMEQERDEEFDDAVEHVLNVCCKHDRKATLAALKGVTVKMISNASTEQNKEIIRELLSICFLGQVKEIAKKLDLNFHGSAEKIRNLIVRYASNEELPSNEKGVRGKDRWEIMVDEISYLSQSQEWRDILGEYIKRKDIVTTPGKSSVRNRISEILDHISTEKTKTTETLYELCREILEMDVAAMNNVCEELNIDTGKLPRKTVPNYINLIAEWVDEKDPSEDQAEKS